MNHILIVSDDSSVIQTLQTVLQFLGEAHSVSSAAQASKNIKSSDKDLIVFVDLEGVDDLNSLITAQPQTPFIGVSVKELSHEVSKNLVAHVNTPITYPFLTQAL